MSKFVSIILAITILISSLIKLTCFANKSLNNSEKLTISPKNLISQIDNTISLAIKRNDVIILGAGSGASMMTLRNMGMQDKHFKIVFTLMCTSILITNTIFVLKKNLNELINIIALLMGMPVGIISLGIGHAFLRYLNQR